MVEREFRWPGLSKDVRNYVKRCDMCTRAKHSQHKPYGLLQPLPILVKSWQSLTLDFITDLPKVEGFNTIMTVADRFSKMARFIPPKGLPTSETTAKMFIK